MSHKEIITTCEKCGGEGNIDATMAEFGEHIFNLYGNKGHRQVLTACHLYYNEEKIICPKCGGEGETSEVI